MQLIPNRKYALRIDGMTYLGTALSMDIGDPKNFVSFIDLRKFYDSEQKVLPPCQSEKTVVFVNVNKIEMIAEIPCN